MCAFRTTSVESLHAEAYDPTIELRRNKLGLKFLYRLRSNTKYTESLNTLDDREDQNYEENKGTTKPTGLHLIKLEQCYMGEHREVEKNHLAQQLP